MILINPKVKMRRGDVIGIVPFGDIHIGSEGYDEDRAYRIVDYIRPRKNVYAIGMGDYIDAIVYTDTKRFNPAGLKIKDLSNVVMAQAEKAIELFKPIRDRTFGMLEGNHEYEVTRRGHFNSMLHICKELKLPYLSYSAVITLSLTRLPKHTYNYQIYAHHGWGGGKNFGAGLSNVNQMKNFVNDCDLYLMGHVHKQMVAPLDGGLYVSRRDPLKMRERLQYGVLTGSFMNTFPQGTVSYTEKQGYPSVKKGCPVIWLRFSSNAYAEKTKQAPIVSLDGVTFI